jgi:hypothetical protein
VICVRKDPDRKKLRRHRLAIEADALLYRHKLVVGAKECE